MSSANRLELRPPSKPVSDEDVLSEFGYKQELNRNAERVRSVRVVVLDHVDDHRRLP